MERVVKGMKRPSLVGMPRKPRVGVTKTGVARMPRGVKRPTAPGMAEILKKIL